MAKKEKVEAIQPEESRAILKLAIKDRGTTQVDLADKLGMYQSGLSGLINRPKMTLYGFGTILNAMDYDIAVVDRATGEVKWIVAVK